MRWAQHLQNARSGRDTYLYRAIRKYGGTHFSAVAIASCLAKDTAWSVERDVIQSLRSNYNQTNGGEFTIGRQMSAETRAKIIAGNTGRKRTPEQNAVNSAKAKARYVENPVWATSCLSALAKGRENCDRSKQRAAVAKASSGRIWSTESRAKLSASCMGRKHGAEVLSRISAAHNKPVECITLNTVFDSVSEAAKGTGLSISGVSGVCSGRRNSANGLVFQFVNLPA